MSVNTSDSWCLFLIYTIFTLLGFRKHHLNLLATLGLSMCLIIRFHVGQAGRTGAVYSNDAASGQGNAASGGSSSRGPPSSAAGEELSPEAYCRRHEITVNVSIYESFWILFIFVSLSVLILSVHLSSEVVHRTSCMTI